MNTAIPGFDAFGRSLSDHLADTLYLPGPRTAPLAKDLPLAGSGAKPWARARMTRRWQTGTMSPAALIRANGERTSVSLVLR